MASLALKPAPAWQRSISPLLLLAAAVVAALIQSFLVPIDSDVSWLITANEKMLAGQRLYVDIIEPNPPASLWLYTPALWLAQATGMRPEAVVAALFIAGGLGACVATARISARLARPPREPLLIIALSFATMILPLGTFAQREHGALLLMLPVAAALAVMSEGKRLTPAVSVLIGVLAGFAICIKPHFALAIAAPSMFALVRSRNIRPLIAPAIAATVTVTLYAGAIFVFASEYLQLLPMLAATYLPLREQWAALLAGPTIVVPAAIYALVWALRAPRLPPLVWTLLLSSAGFAGAALIQMKGYYNHALPAIALGLIALVLAASAPNIQRQRRRVVLAAAGLLTALQLYAMGSIRPPAGVAEVIERVAPPQPGVIALSPDLLTGHPVVRNVGGRWAGSRPALFIAAGARRARAEGSRVSATQLQGWYRDDLKSFADDVANNRPDVVLVDTRRDVAWLRNEPPIEAAMASYRPVARVGDVEVWIRR